MRKKLFLVLSSSVLIHFLFIFAKSQPFKNINSPFSEVNSVVKASDDLPAIDENVATSVNSVNNSQLSVYDELHLTELDLSRYAFDYAVKGYNYLLSTGKLKNDQIISIVDFSQASSRKRLYIIDLKNKKVLFNTYVSHGRNSGREIANEFSNEPESNKSSLGFYVTGDTYIGKHGFSMRLFGTEKGINDNANSRAIVMHSAPYVSEGAIRMQGFIGRSLGCPALPENLYKPIIETIKNGSCLFLYSPDKYYAAHSDILKKNA
ncbi:MAG: murein L,D-transpeptidase catalytic domain family protein [Segetibacter sp.]